MSDATITADQSVVGQLDADRYDAEFFIDTACPWCWITSRWVTNVQAERNLKVRWRFIALKILNEANSSEYSQEHRDAHTAGFNNLRLAHAVRELEGNDALAALYTAIGTEIHVRGRFEELMTDQPAFLAACLETAGLDPSYAKYADDDSRDAALRTETEEALARTGPDVGTPIITFNPGRPNEASLFGPVIPKAPNGDEAVTLWDAVATLAGSGVAEIKRTLRGDISFD